MALFLTISRKLVYGLAVALVVAAAIVPASEATGAPVGKYGPLDPWAYNVIHAHSQSVTPGGRYGPLDPWAYRVIRQAREESADRGGPPSSHSVVQNRKGHRTAASSTAKNGFDWRDASIGAAGTLGLVLLSAGTALALRKRGALAHIHL